MNQQPFKICQNTSRSGNKIAPTCNMISHFGHCLCMLILKASFGMDSVEPDEQLLHNFIKSKNISKLIRPTGTDSVKLTVKLGMRLSQLLDVDEKNQIMTTSVWLRQEWTDMRLRWDPTEHGGIEVTHIPSEELWRPDIVLYNNADGEYVVTLMTKASLYYTGKIVWEPPVIYKSYCPIDVEYFPFDMQECFLKFGTWTYDGHQVDLQHLCDANAILNEETNEKVIDRGIDLKDFYQNVEWDIINVTARRKDKFYPCCPEPYTDITFNITLRRRTLFYSLNLIAPCLTISCLTVLVFYLPADSGEKITLSVSILLALTVFFLLLSDINPPTSFVIPLIGKYLLFTMIILTMSIFLTVYNLNIHFRSPSTHKMHPWVRKIFIDILPRILHVKRPESGESKNEKLKNSRTPNGNLLSDKKLSETCCNHEFERITPNAFETAHCSSSHHCSSQNVSTGDQGISHYPREVREALNGVKFVADHIRSADEDNMQEKDWKYVAMVMDRLFLYIFTTACICGSLSIFLYAPSLYDHRQALPLEGPSDKCSY